MVFPTIKLSLEIATFVIRDKKVARMLEARDSDIDTMGTKLGCNYLNTETESGIMQYEVIFEFATQPDKEQNDDIKVLVNVDLNSIAKIKITAIHTY